MWWAKGAVSARLLTVRKSGSCKAAPKRHQQPDFQATDTGRWKAPTSGDLNSCSPGLFLLQRRQQQGEQAAAVGGSDSSSEGVEEQAPPARSSSSSDVRHSQQVRAGRGQGGSLAHTWQPGWAGGGAGSNSLPWGTLCLAKELLGSSGRRWHKLSPLGDTLSGQRIVGLKRQALAQTLPPGGHFVWPKEPWGSPQQALARILSPLGDTLSGQRAATAATPSACLPACPPACRSASCSAACPCSRAAGWRPTRLTNARSTPLPTAATRRTRPGRRSSWWVGLCCGRQRGPRQALLLLLEGTGTNPVWWLWLPQTLKALLKPVKTVSKPCQNALKTLLKPLKRGRMTWGIWRGFEGVLKEF